MYSLRWQSSSATSFFSCIRCAGRVRAQPHSRADPRRTGCSPCPWKERWAQAGSG
nr:hypothetical protein [Pseudomonas sp. Root569]